VAVGWLGGPRWAPSPKVEVAASVHYSIFPSKSVISLTPSHVSKRSIHQSTSAFAVPFNWRRMSWRPRVSIFYTPILPLAYRYIEYTAAVGASKGSLPMTHQRRFSLLMETTRKIVTYRMEHSHLMEQKGTLEHEQMRRKRILYS
jgi:hypothetical protein